MTSIRAMIRMSGKAFGGKGPGKPGSFRRAGASFVLLAFLFSSCASERPHYRNQIEELIFELAVTNPVDTEEVFDFSTRHSYRLNLGLKGLDEELIEILEEQGPWYEKLLVAHLLALSESTRGFAAIIDMADDSSTAPEVREGLSFCGMKFFGFTERDTPPDVTGWDADLDMWDEALDRIEEVGLHNWRRELIKDHILSGRPGSGDAAQAVSIWLSHTLEPADVPFLNDLLGRGSPKCDLALLAMIEKLLMRRFMPESDEGGLDEGLNAFRAWYGEWASRSPDDWMADAFSLAGYELKKFYSQASITTLVNGLGDDSENRVLVRGHALKALNRICGFHVDRRIIFLETEERERAAGAYLNWYEDLAKRMLVE